jgi:hypothetical protein
MRRLNNGQLLYARELEEIACNLEISRHAVDRIMERSGFETIADVQNAIRKPLLAYFNTDYSINVAVDKYNYFVVVKKRYGDGYLVVTYKEKSHNNIDIYKKMGLARKGVERTA